MSEPTANASWLLRLKSALGPRGGLVVLVAAHLLLIIGLSHPWLERIDHWLPSSWLWACAVIPHGVHFAQVGLIAAMAVLGGGFWFLRWPRCMMLVVWLAVGQIAGSWLLAENRDGTLLEQFLMFFGFQFFIFVVPLALIRLGSGRRFRLPGVPLAPRFQFRIVHLLLLIGEVAVLLALVRAIVPYNRGWWDEVRDNLPKVPAFIERGIFLVSLLAIIPAIIAAAWPVRVLRNLAVLVAYEIALALAITLLHVGGIRWLPSLWAEPPSVADLFWESTSAAVGMITSAVITIWLSLLYVRFLGYDFLPRPRRGGRQSSEATSAA